jgi:membrane protein DedA with SNARE-associated domain
MDRLVDYMLNFYGPTPYFILCGILMACGLGLPIPEDITLFAGGLMAFYGITDIWLTILVCLFGVLFGDAGIFFLGSKYGRKLTKKWFFHRLLPDDRLDAVKKRLHDQGNKLIFIARFMPGFRAPIYFTSGTLHLPFRVFLFYDGLAALLSVPAIIGAVYIFGDQLDRVVRVVQRIEHGIVFVVAAVVLAAVGKWYLTHRKLKVASRRKANTRVRAKTEAS